MSADQVTAELTVGQLAARAGVRADTIRYYEREGLLPVPHRTEGEHRRYGCADVDRLLFIRGAQRLGLRLAEIALSYVRSHAVALGIDPAAFAGKRFHVHVPAGAIPKDGPSAGVTMTTALVSLLRDTPVRSVLGMTGEVTLQGRVLPIGGVRQKVLAAHRAGLTSVVLPVRNGPDLEDVPEAVRDEMTFHLASDISEVLEAALADGVPAEGVADNRAPVVQAAA